MSKPMTAQKLSIILALSLFGLIGIGIAGFIYSRNLLFAQATDTAKVTAQAASSNEELQALKGAQKTLDANKDIEVKAANLSTDSKSYLYQNRIVSDITNIANRAGIEVVSIEFTDATSNSTTTTTTTPVPTAAIGGLREITVNVTLHNPVSYDRLMAFMSYIEQNSTKMQIAKISMTNNGKDKDGVATVTSDIFNISVYVR